MVGFNGWVWQWVLMGGFGGGLGLAAVGEWEGGMLLVEEVVFFVFLFLNKSWEGF